MVWSSLNKLGEHIITQRTVHRCFHDPPYIQVETLDNLMKGAAATGVREEEGGMADPVKDEEVPEMGTVKHWNAEKGFGFIGRTSEEEGTFVTRNHLTAATHHMSAKTSHSFSRKDPKVQQQSK